MSAYFPVVIHHNPACATSRNVVNIVKAAGYRPEIVEYLQTGWTRVHLLALFAAAGLKPHQALRLKSAVEPGITNANASDDDILVAMVENPVLVNRPFVATPLGVRLCRPSEIVLNVLHAWPPGPFYKEDGEMIIDGNGKQII